MQNIINNIIVLVSFFNFWMNEWTIYGSRCTAQLFVAAILAVLIAVTEPLLEHTFSIVTEEAVHSKSCRTSNTVTCNNKMTSSVCVYYCKRGYFRWGKISRKCWLDLSRGGNFHDISPISLIKSYGFYFPVGEIFAKKAISRKTRNCPTQKSPRLQYCYRGALKSHSCGKF